MGQPYIDQDSFRWRKDDGGEIAATWHQLINVDWAAPVLDQIVRLRFLLQNTGDKDRTDGYRLEYNVDSAGWVPVTTTSSYVRSCGSANTSWTLTDEDATTKIIGGGTFDEGYWDDTGTTTSFTFAIAQESELEFCFQFRSAELSGGESVDLRVAYDDGVVLDLYTNTPTTVIPSAPVGVFQQSHFRVRTGDTYGLNVDDGWKAALDTDCEIDAETIFRVRFEIEEIDSKSATKTLKFQYKKGAGAWTDLVYEPYDETATTNPTTFITLSAQYVDAAATTNVLAGSAKTFTAGTGEENNTLPSLTMNNQHTEYEVTLVIHTFYDGPTQNVDGNTFQLRMVESDNTILGGVYVTPTITLNVPAGLIGGTMIEAPGRIGPFCDTNGNLYTIIENTESEAYLLMIKSTDGGDTWAEVDGTNRPTNIDLEGVDIQQVTDTLWILHQGAAGGDPVWLHKFRMSDHATNPDTWELTDEVVAASINAVEQMVGIAVLSDGRVRAFWNQTDTDEEVYYNTRSTVPAWGTAAVVDATASVDFFMPVVVLGASDMVHIFYVDNTNSDIYHKSLSSGNTLSARELVEADALIWGPNPISTAEAVYWDSAGDEKVMLAFLDESDELLYSAVVTNDGTPETRKVISGAACDYNEGGSRQPAATLVVDQATDTCYVLYVPNVAQDISRDKAVDDGGWGTDEVELAHTNIDWVRGWVFTHSAGNGGAKVLGYLYDIGSYGGTGFIWYGESELAGATITFSASLTAASATPDTVPLPIKRGMVGVATAASVTPDDPMLAVLRGMSATVLAASTTPDDVVLGFLVALSATVLAASTTPDTVPFPIGRSFVAQVLGASVTPEVVDLAVLRGMSATVLAASVTPEDVALAVKRSMSATITAVSAAPDDVALAFLISLAGACLAVSTTPDDVSLTMLWGLTAEILASSTTSDNVSLAVARAMLATILAQSVTPDDVDLDIGAGLVALAAIITAVSTTPSDVDLAVARAMSAIATAISATPNDVALGVRRGLEAAILAVSLSPDDVALAIRRGLSATATGVSVTPDSVALAIARAFVATVLAQTSTPDDLMLAVARSFEATATGISVTPDDVTLGFRKAFAAAILAASQSPDDIALAIRRGMAATVTAASVTPNDVALVIARVFAASILAQSSTPEDVALAVRRGMAATVLAQSVTPDDVTLLLAILIGLMYASFAGRQPGVAFEGRQPGMAFTGRDPGSDMIGRGG